MISEIGSVSKYADSDNADDNDGDAENINQCRYRCLNKHEDLRLKTINTNLDIILLFFIH